MNKDTFSSNKAIANNSGTMETETIQKNGASSKSKMSRRNKNLIKFFGIIALCSAIGFPFAGCDGGLFDDDEERGEPTVTINGTAKITETISAISSSNNFSGDYKWLFADSPDAYDFAWGTYNSIEECYSGANRSKFTIPIENPNLLGKYIRASRHNHITNTTIYSNIIGPIQLADKPAIAISGNPQLLSEITAKSDPNFSGNYKWYYASSANPPSWTEIPYEYTNGNRFTIPVTDLNGESSVGKYIMVKRLHNNVSEIQSNVLGPIQQGNLDGLVLISGTPKVGVKFTATSNSDFSGNYKWVYASTPNSSLWSTSGINEECYSGTSRNEFTIPTNLVGKYIKASRRNHMTGRDVWSSNVIGPIRLAD